MANWNRQTWAHGIVNAWERMPYIYGAKERVLSLSTTVLCGLQQLSCCI